MQRPGASLLAPTVKTLVATPTLLRTRNVEVLFSSDFFEQPLIGDKIYIYVYKL